ncbi:MAG: hypothetical protein DRP85_09280 [Candidatus Makaraimicrobium thalassicum]|nr:MAG: hypothetical protein DRP85_09280 [Candidatus Omnitrophota bacterium]
MRRHGFESFDALVSVAKDPSSGIRDELVSATVPRETWWFRDPECFDALVGHVLPTIEERALAGSDSKVRLLSAGCSTGQEAYSLAIAIAERSLPPEEDRSQGGAGGEIGGIYEIRACDVSASALFIAIAGRYDQVAISRGLTDSLREKFFEKEGETWKLRDGIRRAVKFFRHDVASSVPPPGGFHVIMLRNVLEYYSDEGRRRMLKIAVEALEPGGFLVLSSRQEVEAAPLPEEASVTELGGWHFVMRKRGLEQ